MREPGDPPEFVVRPATPEDYAAFARLFPELEVDDPVPGPAMWASEYAPFAWIAEARGAILGYCYCQEFEDAGYVRNVVVAPSARRRGVGRALMDAVAGGLRARGKRSWRLNVKPDNVAALALYARMGLKPRYSSRSLRFPWRALAALPAGNARVRVPSPAREAALERLFELPRGQIAFARDRGRVLLEALEAASDRPIGLAVFDPKFPGAFPFRATEVDAVQPLLVAMRGHVMDDEHVNLVAEDDERLVQFLIRAGATVREGFLHMYGSL